MSRPTDPFRAQEIKAVDGKVPISLFESRVFLDYDRYEENLKIVRDR